MRYAIWNNKGGVGKTFLSFVLATEKAIRTKDQKIILVDMCPQANLSEIILGGNGKGVTNLEQVLSAPDRKTVGGYFDTRITSPHQLTGSESSYLINAHTYNENLPQNLYILCGDPSLEIQSQVISQIGGQTLPENAWMNVHNWLLDLIKACCKKVSKGPEETTVFIDCNPSFSPYTELAMIAAEQLIIPCSSDGSSARAIDNIGFLLYGLGIAHKENYKDVNFEAKAKKYGMPLPMIHSIVLNRSTLYKKDASKAFKAMFDEIQSRAEKLKKLAPQIFISGDLNFTIIPDNHSVAIVSSHLGKPLNNIVSGKYTVYDTNPQINPEPLDRYKHAVNLFMESLTL